MHKTRESIDMQQTTEKLASLLSSSKKIQTWIHAHPRKATIVRHVITEFDDAINAFENPNLKEGIPKEGGENLYSQKSCDRTPSKSVSMSKFRRGV